MCGDSERTVRLTAQTPLAIHLQNCTSADLQGARQRARRAISINSSCFVFPASRGVSMVTLYAVKRGKHCSASLRPPVVRAAVPTFPAAQLGPDRETALLFRYCCSDMLPHAAARLCPCRENAASLLCFYIPSSRPKGVTQEGRRKTRYISVINVCCL